MALLLCTGLSRAQPSAPPQQVQPADPTADSRSSPDGGHPDYPSARDPVNQLLAEWLPQVAQASARPLQTTPLNRVLANWLASFGRKSTRRSGKLGPVEASLLYNSIPGSSGPSAEHSLASLNALNEAISSAMLGLGGSSPPAHQNTLNQVSSFLSANLGKGSKKILDLPKQLYKAIGEKLSGAGEAAVSATLPLKDSLLGTLKSVYSYIKPARSSHAPDSPAPQDTPGNALFGLKRRQSDSLAPVAHAYPQAYQSPSPAHHYPGQLGQKGGSPAKAYRARPEVRPPEYGSRPDSSGALYQKSKQLFGKISRKRLSSGGKHPSDSSTYGLYLNPAHLGLSGQTLSKIQSKLGTLPALYKQSGKQYPPGNERSVWRANPSQPPLPPYGHHQANYPAYLTRSQLGLLPPTAADNATPSPLSTSTSVSASVHESAGDQQPDLANPNPSSPDPPAEEGESTSLYYASAGDKSTQAK